MANEIKNYLKRDLYVLENEADSNNSDLIKIWPPTILDQVFDNTTPENKNLRDILEEIRRDILTCGRGSINFPVSSVNGKTGAIVLSKNDIGLDKVDNTADTEKPLSDIQRESIMDILNTYDFKMNMDELFEHLNDMSNPHKVSFAQLNVGNEIEDYMSLIINRHNLSTKTNVHPDIRRSLATLWDYMDRTNRTVVDTTSEVLTKAAVHYTDIMAHRELFSSKEDISNRDALIDEATATHLHYPSTKAVVRYIKDILDVFRKSFPMVDSWIEDVQVVTERVELPLPSASAERKVYFIRNGVTSHDEMAICRKNDDGTYDWDISPLGTYSKFSENHFIDSREGLSVNVPMIVTEILNEKNMARELAKSVEIAVPGFLDNYYTKDEINARGNILTLHIIPGTELGTIQFYINGDKDTLSEEIHVAGLQRLAYLEYITENELKDNSVHNNHILSRAIEKRHLNDKIVGSRHVECSYNSIIGNTNDTSNKQANEITMEQLADILTPLIQTRLGI